MHITIIGTGYVGLVSGTCFAEMGIQVTCIDVNQDKINALKQGNIPIYEPVLEDMVLRNQKAGRLHFTTNLQEVIDEVEIIFCAVGTPPDEDGSADLSYVLNVAKQVGQLMNKYLLFVTKSTVPVGTAQKIKDTINQQLTARGAHIEFDVASNPEFLKEGDAIKDFMSPDRVVVGVESERAKDVMTRLYRPFLLNNFRVIFMDIPSAEMTKYAANSMLATRISFMNDIANLCEKVGADVNMVRKGIGSDVRIGNKFLYAGIGYGGSCFPKDVKALIKTGEENGLQMRVLQAVEEVNKEQKAVLFHKLQKHFGTDLADKTIAIWGLSFKANTDDMREATSLIICKLLLDAGCHIRLFDPVAMVEAKRIFSTHYDFISYNGTAQIYFANNIYDAVLDADAALLITEWKEFRMPSWQVVKKTMKGNLILDGRNIYDPKELRSMGFEYEGIGIK